MNQAEVELRKELLKTMHTYMSEYQPYEEAYDRWITVAMPDEPDESDFQFIAEDDKIFAETCVIFGEIVKWIEQEEKGE